MHGMPSRVEHVAVPRIVLEGEPRLEAVRPELGHRGALEPRRLRVVAAVAHDEHVPAQPVVARSQARVWGCTRSGRPVSKTMRSSASSSSRSRATSSTSGSSPQASKKASQSRRPHSRKCWRPGRVGQHAVDVEDDRRPGLGGRGAPAPVGGTVGGGTGAPSVIARRARLALIPRRAAPSTGAGSRRRRRGSASVVVSPRSRPSATSRSSRRMIFPERVLGSSSVKITVFGPGDGPDVTGPRGHGAPRPARPSDPGRP